VREPKQHRQWEHGYNDAETDEENARDR
jgi:hypothetical protein